MDISLDLKFLNILTVFGIMPYFKYENIFKYQRQQKFQYRKGRQNIPLHRRHIPYLRWQQFYTAIIIIGCLLVTLYGVIYIPFCDTSIVANIVSILDFIMHFIVILILLIENIISYEKYYDLITHYFVVEQLFRQLLQMQLCRETIRQRQKRKYTLYAVSVYGCLIFSLINISLNSYDGYIWHSLGMFLIFRARCFQILLLLDYIVYYMETLHLKLKAIISCRILKLYNFLDVDYNYVQSIVYMQYIKCIYSNIYILHMRCNEIFGLSLLTLLCLSAFDIIIHMYWSFLSLMGFYGSHVQLVIVFTLVPLFSIILMLCYTADECEKVCNLILISLKHLIKPASTCIQTADYNALLRDFIMQIIHNPIRITANEYFTINLKFLMGISANIVTYLVILLQFRKTSNAKAMSLNDQIISYDTNITTADMTEIYE